MYYFERLIALILLVILLPVMLVVSIVIFVFEPFKPVFYMGIRIGMYGRRFVMYKFRTLKLNAESVVNGGLLNDHMKLETLLGRILRYTKLDELPQLFNIVKGDMSFIGPRPVRPSRFYDALATIDDYEKRFLVKPGLSGIAQVEGGYYSTEGEKLTWDLYWIDNMSLKLYFNYIFKTILQLSNKVLYQPVLSKVKVPWISLIFIFFIR